MNLATFCFDILLDLRQLCLYVIGIIYVFICHNEDYVYMIKKFFFCSLTNVMCLHWFVMCSTIHLVNSLWFVKSTMSLLLVVFYIFHSLFCL